MNVPTKVAIVPFILSSCRFLHEIFFSPFPVPSERGPANIRRFAGLRRADRTDIIRTPGCYLATNDILGGLAALSIKCQQWIVDFRYCALLPVGYVLD
jgi:hypothetical protein